MDLEQKALSSLTQDETDWGKCRRVNNSYYVSFRLNQGHAYKKADVDETYRGAFPLST
jgi:hypothetical protein